MAGGMRRMGSLDLGDIRRGLENLANPDAGLLEMLGRTRAERVERMAALLRKSSPDDMEEMGAVYTLAMARLAEEQARAAAEPSPRPHRTERARRRRDQTAAEWRKERRLTS